MLARGLTTMFLAACAWKLSYMRYQCPDRQPKPSLPVTSLYDTDVLLNSNYSFLAIGRPYWYVISPHICHQYSFILLQSYTWIDCTTVTVMPLPLFLVRSDTER